MAGPKFGALTQLRTVKRELAAEERLPSPPLSTPVTSAVTPAPPTPVPRPPGRPPGKRSNAEWDYANILRESKRRSLRTASLRMRGPIRTFPNSSSGCLVCTFGMRFYSFRRP